MQVKIPAGVLKRLSRVNQSLPPDERRSWLASFFIECRKNHVIVGATDSKFAAFTYCGVQEQPDGFAVIGYNTAMLTSVASVSDDMDVIIAEFSAMGFCSVAIPNLFQSQGDAAIRDVDAVETLSKWRNWLPDDVPAEPGRAMFLDVDRMSALVSSSPSGRVTFPRHIDANKAIVVRDVTDANWLGLLIARPENGTFMDGAQIPQWVGK